MRQSLNVLSCALARVRLAEFTVIRPTYLNMSLHRLGQLPGLQCERYTASGCTRFASGPAHYQHDLRGQSRRSSSLFPVYDNIISHVCFLFTLAMRKILVFFLIRNDYTLSPDCLPILLSITVFLLFSFSVSPLFSCWFRAVDDAILISTVERTLK